jgi:hypothetical protein
MALQDGKQVLHRFFGMSLFTSIVPS